MRPSPEVDQASLDALFDQFPHQLWIADGDGLLRRANRQLVRYFGPHLETAGSSLPDLVSEEDRARVIEAWGSARLRGEAFQVEARMPAADGAVRWFLIAAAPLSGASQTAPLWYGTNTDIEETRATRADLERALQVQQRALATANHDLRQPLSAILFLIAALQQRISGDADRRMLEAIGNSIHSMKVMVDNQLDFVRLSTDTLRAEPSDVSVNGILTRLAIEFGPLAASKGLSFSVHPCSAMVHTDPQLLERMLRNLLLNAVRYTRSGRIVLGCRRSGRHLRIEVHDTGRGIEDHDRGQVTEPFYRSSRSILEHPGGLGLGLAVVDRLAQELGHELHLRSRPGQGTTASVLAPFSELPNLPPVRSRAHGRHLLIVAGDEPVPTEMLQGLGCRIDTAADMAEAAALLARGPLPDLVLCGLMHGGAADGVLRLRQLLAPVGEPVRSLLVTEASEPVRLREMLLSGYPFLCLPVPRHELEAKLVEVLLRRD